MYIKTVCLLLFLAYLTLGETAPQADESSTSTIRRRRTGCDEEDTTKSHDVRKIRKQYEAKHLVHKKNAKPSKHDNAVHKNGTTTQETKADAKQEKKSEVIKVQERAKIEETKTDKSTTKNNDVTEKSEIATTPAAPKTLYSAFKDNKIIPDVFFVGPEKILNVTYASDKEVNLGNELTPKQVINSPTVKYPAENDSFYTLIMTDPDAPSRKNPKAREWHHWLVVNIPGSEVSKGETLSQYIGSAPPQASGLHRYVFLLFKQPEKLKFRETIHHANDGNRAKFNTQAFSKKYNLGSPVAGNFFQAQWDESVPATHRRLGFK